MKQERYVCVRVIHTHTALSLSGLLLQFLAGEGLEAVGEEEGETGEEEADDLVSGSGPHPALQEVGPTVCMRDVSCLL